jgi:hypothetical protein
MLVCQNSCSSPTGYHRNLDLLRSSLCLQPKEVQKMITLFPFGVGDAATSCYFMAWTDNISDGLVECGKTLNEMRALEHDGYLVRGSMEVVLLDWLVQVRP